MPEPLAVYAAVLSTIVFIWNIVWAVRLSRSRLKIAAIPSYGMVQGKSIDGFLVSISNPSAVRVTLFEVTVWHEREKYSAVRHWWNRNIRRKTTPEGWVNDALKTENYMAPTTLGPGEAVEFIAPIDAVMAASKGNMPVKFSVRDGHMRRHFAEASRR